MQPYQVKIIYVVHHCLPITTYILADFDLPRHTWFLMNRFRTGQGPCRANLHNWGLAQSPSCDCGQRQTMNHIVDTCPLTTFEGGLSGITKIFAPRPQQAFTASPCPPLTLYFCQFKSTFWAPGPSAAADG